MTPLLAVELPIIGFWIGLALLEILFPARVIRRRKRLIDKRRSRFGGDPVADAVDTLSHERGAANPWTLPSVQRKVRAFGFVNLFLALVASFVVLVVLR